jgi:hypothetical protein
MTKQSLLFDNHARISENRVNLTDKFQPVFAD